MNGECFRVRGRSKYSNTKHILKLIIIMKKCSQSLIERTLKRIILLFFILIIWSNIKAQTGGPISDQQFFGHLDLTRNDLKDVKIGLENGGSFYDAKIAYVNYVNSTKIKYFYYVDNKAAMISKIQSTPDGQTYLNKIISDADKIVAKDNATGFNELEVERLEFLKVLGLAYWTTDNAKYVNKFVDYTNYWIANNPTPLVPITNPYAFYTVQSGPYRAIDAGTRIGELLRGYMFFMNAPQFSMSNRFSFLRHLMEEQYYMESFYKINGISNWFVAAATRGIEVSVMFPEWDKSSVFTSLCRSTLNNSLIDFHDEDGFQKEYSLGYHEGMVEMLGRTQYFLSNLQKLPGLELSALGKLKKGFDLIWNLKKPNGKDPVIADISIAKDPYLMASDIGNSNVKLSAIPSLIFPETRFRDYVGINLPPSEIAAYGSDAYDRFMALGSWKEINLGTIRLENSGVEVMRSGTGKDNKSLYCLFDKMVHGAGGHSHHDYLNMELFAFGRTLLVDPGKGPSYLDVDIAKRAFLGSVKGHNTIYPHNDSNPNDVIFYNEVSARNPNNIKSIDFKSNPKFDYTSGRLLGYNSTDITRNIFFVKGEYWYVRDKITGSESKTVDQYWQTWSETKIPSIQSTTKKVSSNFSSGPNIHFVPINTANLTVQVNKFPSEFNSTEISSLNINNVVYTKQKVGNQPVTFDMVIFPTDVGMAAPALTTIKSSITSGNSNDDNSTSFSLDIGNGKKDYLFVSDEVGKEVSFNNGSTINYGTAKVRTTNNIVTSVDMFARAMNFKLDSNEYGLKTNNGPIGTASLVVVDVTNFNLSFNAIHMFVTVPFYGSEKNLQYRVTGSSSWLNFSSLETDNIKKTVTGKLEELGDYQLRLVTAISLIPESPENNKDGLEVYPNPFESNFFIKLNTETTITLTIYDTQGKLVQTPQTFINKKNLNIQNNLKSGLYILKILGGSGTLYTKKITIK
jgi:hypothetical protein